MDQIVPRHLHFDRFTLDLTRGCVWVGERDVDLPPKAFDVLRVLAENAGRLVSKQELYDAVWPGVAVTDDSLVQRIRELRQLLGDDDHSLIKTVSRRGYLLNATLLSPAKPDEIVSLPHAAAEPVPALSHVDRARRPARWRWTAVAFSGCVALAWVVLSPRWPALVGMFAQPNGAKNEPALASALPDISRLRDLPRDGRAARRRIHDGLTRSASGPRRGRGTAAPGRPRGTHCDRQVRGHGCPVCELRIGNRV